MAYKNDVLPLYEQWVTEANGKYLLGTDEITMLDIHCGSLMEGIYLWEKGPYLDVDAHLRIRENAPNWVAYMERFRNPPAIKPYRVIRQACDNHGVRSRAWDPNEKCQLSLAILEGVFPDAEE